MRNRGWRRKKDFSKAKRKRNLDLEISYHWADDYLDCGFYRNLHQYSKNKIHCSCGMCSAKTRNKGKRRKLENNYSPSINYSIKDKKKIDSMNDELLEFIQLAQNKELLER